MEFTDLLIGGFEIIGKLYAEWASLCEEGASNNPFLRPEWFKAFVQTFELHIMLLTVRHSGKLRAILPLMNTRSTLHGVPVRKLQAVFNLNTQRYDLIHGADEKERKQIVAALWREIKKQPKWQVLEIRLVENESWLKDLLAVANSENYHTGIWQMDSAPFISLSREDEKSTSVDDHLKGLSKKHRLDLDRRMRRLKESGKVEFVIGREYSPELMEKFFEIEARGWKGRAKTAAADDANVKKLHDDFARATAANDALFVYELKLDGETIAMQLRVRYDMNTICWKTTYDENYRRFSPGNLLFREFLRECLRNGSCEVDLLCPPSESKKLWASGERELFGFYIFQRGMMGSLIWKYKFTFVNYLRRFKNVKGIKRSVLPNK